MIKSLGLADARHLKHDLRHQTLTLQHVSGYQTVKNRDVHYI